LNLPAKQTRIQAALLFNIILDIFSLITPASPLKRNVLLYLSTQKSYYFILHNTSFVENNGTNVLVTPYFI